uniref:F-box domain-containing protein n=1 Tax=Parascaris univalens TaxID=6257 RepID=A0A915A7F1_PARUN
KISHPRSYISGNIGSNVYDDLQLSTLKYPTALPLSAYLLQHRRSVVSKMTNEEGSDSTKTFSDLPLETVSHILSFLTFEELSFSRAVSKNFDALARWHLNASFFRLEGQIELVLGNVKKILPKEESQRRNHSLLRGNKICLAFEVYYSLLHFTFGKHIDDESCCFIAGKVLDEAFALIHTLNKWVKRNVRPLETQKLLDDFCDYSSMAAEYFDEQIAPTFRKPDAHGRDPPFSPTSPRSTSANRNASSRSSYNSPCVSTSSFSDGGSVPSEVLKLFEWRKDMEEELRNQESTIHEQGAAINSIIDCVHQIGTKISLTSTKSLKALGECASSSSYSGEASTSIKAPVTISDREKRGRKRKTSPQGEHSSQKISTHAASETWLPR